MPNSNVRITAVWKAVDYRITVNANGGTGTAASRQTANVGDAVTLTWGSKEGYTFDRWLVVKPATGLGIVENAFGMPAADVELTANWTVRTYRVSFDTAGGSGNPATQTVNHGQTASRPADPVRGVDVFLGWFEESSPTGSTSPAA